MAKGRNWDAAKRREWRNEARREKAMERRHEAIRKQAERELKAKGPATDGQVTLIRKWNMHIVYGHDEAFLETITFAEARSMLDRWAKEHNWKKKNKKPTKKVDTSTFRPWRSGDVKITNTKTGEVRYERNQFRGKPKPKQVEVIQQVKPKPDMTGPNIIRSKGPKKSNRIVTNSSGE